MSITIAQYACVCGAQSEGFGSPPPCWSCGGPMKQWRTREAEYAPFEMRAAAADTRTTNGGY